MAFAVRNAHVAEENVNALKDMKAGSKMSLLQQGSKRRALGDIGNSMALRNAKEAAGLDGTLKPTARAAAAAAPVPVVAPPAQPVPVVSSVRTRSQTAALRQAQTEQGPQALSMSSLLEVRATQATALEPAKPRPRLSRASWIPSSPTIDIDKADRNDPQAVSEYVNDIFSWYRTAELRFAVKPDYMSRQNDINEKMRAILMDWLIEVHLNFKLMPESLHLSINLVDRFLQLKQVSRKNLQLVGVTAMLIASKYEEIWSPEVKDFVHITDKAYSRQQILSMEKLMLNTLQFNLSVATPLNFLVRFLKAAGVEKDKELCMLAAYLVELSLPRYHMLRYSYSKIAAAAVYTAMRAGATACSLPMAYPRALAQHSGYSEQDVLPVAAVLVDLMQSAKTDTLGAVYKKYSAPKLFEVSRRAAPIKIKEEAGWSTQS